MASAEVPVSLVDWVRLDVRNAVVAWQQGMPNLGLLLTVEDTAGRRVDPRLYFQDLSCDAESELLGGSTLPLRVLIMYR